MTQDDLAESLARLQFLEQMRALRNSVRWLSWAPPEKLLALELLAQVEDAGSFVVEYNGANMAQNLAVSSRTLSRCHQNLKARKLISIAHEGQNSRKCVFIMTDTGPLHIHRK